MGAVLAGCSDHQPTSAGSTSSVPGSLPPSVESESGSATTGTTQPPAVRALVETAFTQPWGCGFGFAITNESRTVALTFTTRGAVPVGTSVVTLPDPAWRAEVQFGEGLLDVDCADLDIARPSEPTDSWPVTGGTLHIAAPQPLGCSTPDPAIATVSDLTAAAPDGTTVTLPELTITNDEWGCSAG
jgi:hypothetical protein